MNKPTVTPVVPGKDKVSAKKFLHRLKTTLDQTGVIHISRLITHLFVYLGKGGPAEPVSRGSWRSRQRR